METTLLISIVILNIVLLIVLGLLGYLVYRLLSEKKSINQTAPSETPKSAYEHYHPEIKKRLEGIEFTNPVAENIFCPIHPEEAGEVQCGMCGKYFCNKCIRPMKSIYFCKEHMAVFLRNQWEEILTLKTSSSDPEAGVRLYDKKQLIFTEHKIPTYIETHYKIDVDSDFIETYLVLYAQENQAEQVKELLEE